MIGSIDTRRSDSTAELVYRLVTMHLEKLALVVALICIALIGVLH